MSTFREEMDAARGRGLKNGRKQVMHPEHLEKVVALRKAGKTWAEIGKRWGIRGESVRQFAAKLGAA